MTTERPVRATSVWRRSMRVVLVIVLLVGGWVATMAIVMRFSEATPGALVIVQSVTVLRDISDDLRLMRLGNHVLVVTNGEKGYVERLYGAGAWLVLPALRNGCLGTQAAVPIGVDQRRLIRDAAPAKGA